MMSECDRHGCDDCASFNLSEEKCLCFDCSHGWKRDVEGSECKHIKIYDVAMIERNRRFIKKSKHVLD